MSDLCAPVYVVTDADEELTFWCFVSVMDRMVRDPSNPLPEFRNANGNPLSCHRNKISFATKAG